MLQYKIATSEDIAELMQIRLEMLREVNDLSPDYVFSEEFCLYRAATISLTDSTRRCLRLMKKMEILSAVLPCAISNSCRPSPTRRAGVRT